MPFWYRKEIIMPEVKMYYNLQDDRYYIYIGKDYVADYKEQSSAILCFQLEVNEFKNKIIDNNCTCKPHDLAYYGCRCKSK
jgi:hypothetical protein